jgi:hypothetical protein
VVTALQKGTLTGGDAPQTATNQASPAGYAITGVAVVDVENVRNTRQINSVFLHGRYYSRADLDRLLKKARDLARQ